MAIPGYQEFMLPLLKIAADGQEHPLSDAMDTLAAQMGISEEDQGSLLPSMEQTRFYNRVTWAITYLSKSLLVERSGRGRFRITERGKQILAENPSRIDNQFLNRFAEYRAFKTKRAEKAADTKRSGGDGSEVIEPDATPQERMDLAYEELRDALADELQRRVRAGTPRFFEHLVVRVLTAMGYGGGYEDRADVTGGVVMRGLTE